MASSPWERVLQWRLPPEETVLAMRGRDVLRYAELTEQQQQRQQQQQQGVEDFDRQIQRLLVLSPHDADKIEQTLRATCGMREDACHAVAKRQEQVMKDMLREKKDWLLSRERREEIGEEADVAAMTSSPQEVQSRLALALLCPLLESQSRTDPSLRAATARLLRDLLRCVPPQGLRDGDPGGLNRLEDILVRWLEDGGGGGRDEKVLLCECLVALVCARASPSGLVPAGAILRKMRGEVPSLPGVAACVERFARLEGGSRTPVNICEPGSHRGSFTFDNEPLSEWMKLGRKTLCGVTTGIDDS